MGLDNVYMQEALRLARAAFHEGEVPVGAVVVKDGVVIGRAHNRCEALGDPTAHAEILAVREAAQQIGTYRLTGAAVYVTVEPCLMCAGALHLARVARVVYGCADPKGGAMGSLYRVHEDGLLNHRLEVSTGVMEEDCRRLIQEFFRRLRRRESLAERCPSLAEGG